jgi:hypothetical protein
MQKELRIAVTGLLLATPPAAADEPAPPTPVASIVQFMASHAGGMAARGAFFNDTDVISQPAPMRRFIRAGQYRDQWFLAYETGGIAYNRRVALFEIDRATMTAKPLGMSYYFNSNDCVLIDKMLDGAVSTKSLQDGYW